MADEPKQKFIKFAPLIKGPDPDDATNIACSIEDYNLLHDAGFSVLHRSKSLVTFTKRFDVENKRFVTVNIRYENEKWFCAMVFSWDPNNSKYDSFFFVQRTNLHELMENISLSIHSTQEVVDKLCATIKS